MNWQKLFLGFVAIALFAISTRADNIEVSAITLACPGPGYSGPPFECGGPQVSIQADFTVQWKTGYFFEDAYDIPFYGTEPVVTGVSGLLDGQFPMSWAPRYPSCSSQPCYQGDFFIGTIPQWVTFSADGSTWLLDFDGSGYSVFDFSPPTSQSFLNYSASVPEPSSFVFIAVGLIALASLKPLHRLRLGGRRP